MNNLVKKIEKKKYKYTTIREEQTKPANIAEKISFFYY